MVKFNPSYIGARNGVLNPACKFALATTDNGECRDYATYMETALMSPLKNRANPADSLTMLKHNNGMLMRDAQNGYEYVKRFKWGKRIGKMGRLLLKVLGSRGRKP